MTEHLTAPLINDKVNIHIREENVPNGVGIVSEDVGKLSDIL